MADDSEAYVKQLGRDEKSDGNHGQDAKEVEFAVSSDI